MANGAGAGVTGIDHVVLVVRDLHGAAADMRAAGFTVVVGGRHVEGRTENALIGFADGSYLELIGFTDAPDAPEHRWWPRLQEGEGLVDHALEITNVAAAKAATDAAGLRGAIGGGGRVRPDGQQIAWRALQLGRGHNDPLLPFLVEDLTPRTLRVPSGDEARHANGVTGIAALRLESPDPAATATAYAAVTGAPARDGVVTLGRHRIVITRGDAPRVAALELHGVRGPLDAGRLHGARLVAAA